MKVENGKLVSAFSFQLKSPGGTTEYRQAVECEARNPCEMMFVINQSAVGATEKKQRFCRAYGTFIVYGSLFYRHSALRAPYLPIIFRHYVTFFYETPQGNVSTGDCCKKTTFFLHVALGIAAASFASERAKIERKARRLCRNAQKKG